MKKILVSLTCFLLLVSMTISMSSCAVVVNAKNLLSDYSRNTSDNGEVTGDFTNAISDFAFELFSETLNQQEEVVNKFISPISAMVCLSLIANGAENDTLKQLEDILGMDISSLNRALYAYNEKITADKNVKLTLANSVWFRNSDDNLHVEKTFLQSVVNWYDASIYAAPFDEQTRKDINNWCSLNTDGLIKEILKDPIERDSMMYLINALLFDAKWENKYEKSDIYNGKFLNSDGSESSVTMLNSSEHKYLESDNAYGVIKDYEGMNFAFVGLLPSDASQDIYDFAKSITGENWQKMYQNKIDTSVVTKIPEFKVEDTTDFTNILANMGLVDLNDFLPMANYSGGSLRLSKVAQKTYVELDRNGTKAAAITWGEMKCESAGPINEKYVYLDRPFVYMIIDSTNGIPLFVGVMDNIK